MNTKANRKVPHQSLDPRIRFPGSTIAAREIGVSRQHLHEVIRGNRTAAPTLRAWKQWLRDNPAFARANRKSNPAK
jgi:adenylosuccinate lyase